MNMNIQSVSMPMPLQGNTEASAASVAATALRGMKIAPVTPTAESAKLSSTLDQVKEAVESVKEYVKPFNGSLEFSVLEDTHQVIVKVVDNATKEVIRQIPSEEMVAIARALNSLKGLFVKQQA